jgi:lysyl endopeptidase
MTTFPCRWGRFLAFALLLIAVASLADAGIPVHIVKSDLRPLIRAGAASPVQFAVLVPHSVSASAAGQWSTAADVSTWRYAVQVPTAVSLSFHASRSSLPPGAALVVRGRTTTTTYYARDLRRGDLWSRIQPGDALQFELSVPAIDKEKVSLNLISLQAGYRSLGPGVKDHPYYSKLKQQEAQASGNSSCVTNYECEVTPGNQAPGGATFGLVVSNLYQCTGVLINDVPGDNTPYVLTARHCETGTLGGGDPGAASSVTIYWDAISACGSALGSLYDPGIPIQTGAQTVVEQQDVWLLLLDAAPVVTDAQLAGFDASGGSVQGGYSIHHAEGVDKQYTGWFGTAAQVQQSGVLGVTYLSNFLETVNALGNIGPGASGSGLFDQNNNLVGTLSLGRTTSDPSGFESCPVPHPPAPNGSNGVADFTSVAAVWNSTADTTSTTGIATLKSVLDPTGTGTVVTASLPVENIQLVASGTTASDGNSIQLTWSAANATQCTASGGASGDGWTGQLAASGTSNINETQSTLITYGLSCTYPGGRRAKTSVTVNWVGPTPQLQLSAPSALWVTRPAQLTWTSNVTPCSISGGALSLVNLPGSGTTSTSQSVAGDITYTLTCGPPNNQGTASSSVMYVTPSLVLEQTGSDRILGQTYYLHWSTYGDACVPSGGSPGDGWATTAFFNSSNAPTSAFSPQVKALGTYTYTLTCSSGPLSVQQSVTATFENNAPYVTASLSNTTVTYSGSPADYVTLTWNSNMSSCVPNVSIAYADPLMIAYQAQNSGTFGPSASGPVQISVTCALPGNHPTLVTSTPITLNVLPPPAPVETLTISPTSVDQGQMVTVSWTSTNSANCEGTGGIPGSGWSTNGQFALAPSGQFTYSPGGPTQVGPFAFGLTCESIDSTAVSPTSTQSTLSVNALSDSLKVSATSITVGATFTLTWSSSGASTCTASGGGANGSPWAGSLGTNGTATQTATQSGTFTYTLNCSSDGFVATQQKQITVSPASTGGGGSGGSTTKGSGGGGGGGGSIEPIELLVLLGIRAILCRPRRRQFGAQNLH